MRIVKTSTGTKLVISRKEIETIIGKLHVEAGFLPAIRPSDFFTWLNRAGWIGKRQDGSHMTFTNKNLPDGDPRKSFTVVHHGPEKEVDSNALKSILKRLGVDVNRVHNTGELPRDFAVKVEPTTPTKTESPSRDWRDYQRRPQTGR